MRRPIRVLCVGGHPADTFDSAGGTLAHHAQAGDSVTVVALTAGRQELDQVSFSNLGENESPQISEESPTTIPAN